MLPDFHMVRQPRCRDATIGLSVDARSLRNPRENRLSRVIPASGVRIALNLNQRPSPTLVSFRLASLMNLGHWHGSTDGQAIAEADRPICRCLRVTESDIREAISEHEPQTVQGVSKICGAGLGCMSCHRHIRRMLNERALCRQSDPS